MGAHVQQAQTTTFGPSERAQRFADACSSNGEAAPIDSKIGVGTARKGLRERLWAYATTVVRDRPRVRSLIDTARSLTRSTVGRVCTCTLCGQTARFLPMGVPLRVSVACPRCGSLERHRLLGLYLQRNPDVIRGRLVLHFAPERPVAKAIRAAQPEMYRGADIEVGRADLQLSLEKIDLPDESVDTVIANHILEHVDDRMALAELRRILTPGGRALLMVPIIEGWDHTYENSAVTTNAERTRHFGQADHVRFYGRDLRDRIAAAGFSVGEFTALPADCLEYGLQRGEKLFIATKAA